MTSDSHNTSPAPRSCQILLNESDLAWSRAESNGVSPTVWGAGLAFLDGILIESRQLVSRIQKVCNCPCENDSISRAKDLVRQLDGTWALVFKWPSGYVIAAVNRYRDIPLFYASHGRTTVIACSLEKLCSVVGKPEVDEVSALEFLLAGYVTGGTTLCKQMQQIEAGQLIEFNPRDLDSGPRRTHYFRFFPSSFSEESESELEEQLESILVAVFRRLRGCLEGRRVMVPLSGGLDSRLVAAMLKKVGFENVVCFTYGTLGYKEVEISKAVAEALGYQWHFVEYSRAKWAEWTSSSVMRDYWEYACRGTSLPNIQDLPALLNQGHS